MVFFATGDDTLLESPVSEFVGDSNLRFKVSRLAVLFVLELFVCWLGTKGELFSELC